MAKTKNVLIILRALYLGKDVTLDLGGEDFITIRMVVGEVCVVAHKEEVGTDTVKKLPEEVLLPFDLDLNNFLLLADKQAEELIVKLAADIMLQTLAGSNFTEPKERKLKSESEEE